MALEELLKLGRKRPLFVPGAGTPRVELGRADIERMVPHREPFLLVDGIDAVDLGEQAIRGYRRVDPEDPVFRGHFPGDPVYPGVLVLEAIAQLSLCLHCAVAWGHVQAGPGDAPPRVRLLRVRDALFAAEVRPGDRLTLVGRMVEDTGYTATLAGQAFRGDTLCALAAMEAYLPEA